MAKKSVDDDLTPISGCLQTAARSAFYNIALQIVLRAITFLANACILRYVAKDILGIINVRLMLLYTTIQFISKEPFRRTLAPNADKFDNAQTEQTKWPEIVKVNILIIPWTLVTGLFFSFIWFSWFERPDDSLLYQYKIAVGSIFISALIESFVESFYIYGLRNDFIRVKVVIEGIFQIIRCLTFLCFVIISPEQTISGFAISQLIASLAYGVSYIYFFLVKCELSLWQFIPRKNILFNTTLIKTAYEFLKNSTLKQFLTEGERYIMTVFAVIDFAEQGIYDVVNNLGSLPARLIFQPVEESGYLLFSSLVKREVPVQNQKKRIVKSLEICSNLIKLMLLIGLTLFIYGYNLSAIVLYLYGGNNLTSGEYGQLAVGLFGFHCFYTIFIALNGILECYSFAAMNNDQINRFTYKMLLVSIVFSVTSLWLTSLFGSQGFILANCLNMASRIVISLRFVDKVCAVIGENSFRAFLFNSSPKLLTLFSFVFICSLLLIVRVYIISSYFLYIFFTGVTTVLHLLAIYLLESDLVHFVWTHFLSKRTKSD